MAERLSDAFVCRLSVAYIGPYSRTERQYTIGTEVAHVTHDSVLGYQFQGQKVKGQLVVDVFMPK